MVAVQKTGLVCVVGLVLLGFSGCPGNVVIFPDEALESAVRHALNKPFGYLTEDELLQVTEIQAAALNIRDLRGLEFCRSLTILNLRSNKVVSITPLTNLTNLTWLDLGDNIVTNIEPLAGLFFLEYVDLYGDNNDVRKWDALVANAQAGGLGYGDLVTLSNEWTLADDESLFPDFQDDYAALINAGVTVVFAESDGTTVEF